MPMTYTIKLMKESLILEREGAVASNVRILLGITVVCVIVTVLVELLKKWYAKKKNEMPSKTAEAK